MRCYSFTFAGSKHPNIKIERGLRKNINKAKGTFLYQQTYCIESLSIEPLEDDGFRIECFCVSLTAIPNDLKGFE